MILVLCSTPLQLVNGLRAVGTLYSNAMPLVGLYGRWALSVRSLNTKSLSGMQQITIFVDYPSIIRFVHRHQVTAIFTDSDVGIKNFIFLYRLKVKKLFVYEEGWGTYRKDLTPSGLKQIYKFIGVGWAFGQCRLTDKIVVESPVKYEEYFGGGESQKAIRFSSSLIDILRDKGFIGRDLCIVSLRDHGLIPSEGQVIKVVLTNWNSDEKLDAVCRTTCVKTLIKPHPNMSATELEKLQSICSKNMLITILEQTGMSELLILDLLRLKLNLVVCHFNSSCAKNLSHLKKIRFVNLYD